MSNKFSIGNIEIGGDSPVVIQSMTNTDTNDVEATVEQCKQLFDAGCEMTRITDQGEREVISLEKIKTKLSNDGYFQPLVADVHFNAKVAELSAEIVEKVRINPGNYISKGQGTELLFEKIEKLVEICKQNDTALRVGVNHGSLSEKILNQYGNTALGMAESAMDFIRIFVSLNFEKLVLSMKASSVKTMVDANLLLLDKMRAENFDFPIHLGVTEAGNGEDGRIKSAIGIGTMLLQGIGDTIRVSLTENPVNEIAVAKQILQSSGRRVFFRSISLVPLAEGTKFDIQSLLNEVKAKTSHLKGLKIAVMAALSMVLARWQMPILASLEPAKARFGYTKQRSREKRCP